MDGLTLLVVSLIFSGILTCLWLLSAFLFKADPRTSIHYALTNVMLGLFMWFYVCRSIWPHPIVFILSDLTVVAGCLLLRRSIQEFTETPKTDKEQMILFGVALLVDIMARFTYGGNRVAVVTVCAISLYAIVQSNRDGLKYMIRDFPKKFCVVTLLPLYLMSILIFMRIVITLIMPDQVTDLREGTIFNIAFLIIMMLSLLGFNGTAIGLVISKMITQIRILSQEDPLTKAFNRRHLNELAEIEITNSYKNGNPLSLIALDIDHFKSVNDKYGHAAGDAALISCIQNIKKHLRSTDYVGRLGGEEFCVLLPGTTTEEALVIAERIRASVQANPITWEDITINITASFGVTSLNSNAKNDWSTLLNKADIAMYEAKKGGRNKTIVN